MIHFSFIMQHNEKSFLLKTMEDGQVLLYSVSILVHHIEEKMSLLLF